MKRNKNKALFFIGLSLVLTCMSIYAAYDCKPNEFIGAVLGLCCSIFLGVIACVDYQSYKTNRHV